MVTSVSVSEQIAYAVKSANEQKDKLDKATQSIADIEKAVQKSQEISIKNQAEIEDVYIPSFDFNKTGSDYYNKNWSSQDFYDIQHHSNSLEEFTENFKKTIVKDFADQHNSTDICSAERNSSVKNYLDSIDYEKEYEEYKQSRGCTTDEELRALNTTCFKTKEDLILDAAGNMMVTSKSLYDNGFASQSLISAGVYIPGVVSKMNIQDVANYINSSQYAGNFKNQVSAFQSFADLISKQDNIDENTRDIFAGISKNITNSKGAIAAFSDEIERINAQRASINSQYNASLIAKYDS